MSKLALGLQGIADNGTIIGKDWRLRINDGRIVEGRVQGLNAVQLENPTDGTTANIDVLFSVQVGRFKEPGEKQWENGDSNKVENFYLRNIASTKEI